MLLALFFIFFLATLVSAQKVLSIAEIFSDGMVIQRNEEIIVWGTANSNETVSLTMKSTSFSTNVDSEGNWEITLPKQKVSGPFDIKVSTKKDTINIYDVLVGEVWLASGQSNMHLDLKRTLNGEEIAKRANNPNIRIYNMKPTYPTGKGGVHTLEELNAIQINNYFSTKGWMIVTPENVLYFSAVAYYFSEKLQGELNVPIGIIHNAVPGSPIESWLPKKEIEQDSAIFKLVNERWRDKEDEKDGMISVAKNQISLTTNPNQKHPWMPSYNYINGILPIEKFRFKGVIWYQGESNAEHPVLYKTMFKKMVHAWRSDFNNNLPFYYVQLTSREDRAAWSEFRNAQRELLEEVANSKMVVITDVGDRNDTHAKNKKPVGERLGGVVLGNTYQIGTNYESPLFDKVTESKNLYSIHFKGVFNGIKTSNEKGVIGFEMSNDNINFENFEPTIRGKSVIFKTPKNFKKPIYIRYAWKSYTEANLISNNGLPVSTFRTKIER